jgi:hypothetical protein
MAFSFSGGICFDPSDGTSKLAYDIAKIEYYGHRFNEIECAELLEKWKRNGKTHYPLPTWDEEAEIAVVDFIAYAPLHYDDAQKKDFVKMFEYSLNCARERFISYDDRNHPDYVRRPGDRSREEEEQ